MTYELVRSPAEVKAPRPEPAPVRGWRTFVVRLINYLTNDLVSHVPSFRIRHAWYRRVLGIAVAPGAGVHLGCYFWFYGPGQLRRDGLRIGANTRINRGCCLDARGSLDIGANVSLSRDVMVLTAYHRADVPGFPVETLPVVIEDQVWVGSRATVLPGVRLGRGSVVAAGAVVTRDVAPLSVVAGIPARPVGARPAAGTEYVLDARLPLFE